MAVKDSCAELVSVTQYKNRKAICFEYDYPKTKRGFSLEIKF